MQVSSTEGIRYNPKVDVGLSADQVAQRRREGLYNKTMSPPTKSVGRIILENVFNLFNGLNAVLALLVILAGSILNASFMVIVVANTLIAIIQEIRSKMTVDKMAILSAPTAQVVRDGEKVQVAVDELVLDDITLLSAGAQICADCIVCLGSVEVNESLLTGESEPVFKKMGDMLLSGSFVISGNCSAQVEHVGEKNYASTITMDAGRPKRPNSQLMASLAVIIRLVSIIIVPLGLLLFVKGVFLTGAPLDEVVITTVAALIGMIPEGLMLLTSVALAVGVINLARRKTLAQELYSIETLARVDVLCLDKTGTITEGNLNVEQIVPLSGTEEEIYSVMCAALRVLEDNNATFMAMKQHFSSDEAYGALRIVPFSSGRKWSAAVFEELGSVIIGAPEYVMGERVEEIAQQTRQWTGKGMRVVVVAQSAERMEGETLPLDLKPLGLVVMADRVRPEAPETLRFFREQGVEIKLISGDHPATVAEVARQAGVQHYEKWVDASTLKTREELDQAVEAYTIFGRVSPEQKRQLIQALKKRDHVVAMTGDGVNDVLALREADCSVAMASGSDAVRSVAQLVLMDSNFASMPYVVMEGRRVINNIQRTASLFLVKTIYSFLLALVFLFIQQPYPFIPIQLALISTAAVGMPAFFLALEPDKSRVTGDFMSNVLSRALPAALTIVTFVLLVVFG
ncbi:MAG: cation-translocating P-type ATPase, partial [Christensenellales bacterium]